MSPELQKVLNDALVILVPILTSVVSAWFVGWKNRKDTDAAFQKIRAHEEVLGIETKVQKGVVHVQSVTRSAVQSPNSQPPQGLGEVKSPG